jgi:hypothetical protein
MREYPLHVVGAMIANGQTLKSIEGFIEGKTQLPEEERSALWLLAWSETRRENRRQRVADLMEGERQIAGRLSASGRVDRAWRDESVAGRNQCGLGIGD